jgi:hypothetical protein
MSFRAPASARVALTVDSAGRVVYGTVCTVETMDPAGGAMRMVLQYVLEQYVRHVRFKPGRQRGRAVAASLEVELRLAGIAIGPGIEVFRQARRPWGIQLLVGEELQAPPPGQP